MGQTTMRKLMRKRFIERLLINMTSMNMKTTWWRAIMNKREIVITMIERRWNRHGIMVQLMNGKMTIHDHYTSIFLAGIFLRSFLLFSSFFCGLFFIFFFLSVYSTSISSDFSSTLSWMPMPLNLHYWFPYHLLSFLQSFLVLSLFLSLLLLLHQSLLLS